MLPDAAKGAIQSLMMNLYSTEPDFEAVITVPTPEQSGRASPPQNFIRWDFCYAEDNPLEDTRNLTADLFMIYPNFLDESGSSIQEGVPLSGTYKARMHILIEDMKEYHRKRLSVGTQFNCHEGPTINARGVVTKLLGIST